MKSLRCRGCGEYFDQKLESCPECGMTVDQEKPAPRQQLPRIDDMIEREQAERRWVERGQPTADQSRTRMHMIARSKKPSARKHWHNVLQTKGLPELTYDYARKALDQLEGTRDE